MPSRQSPKWTWDRRAKRWRHGGRWASPPSRSELRVSRTGLLIDGAGKRVPKSALDKEPTKKKKRKPTPKKSKGIKSLTKITKDLGKSKSIRIQELKQELASLEPAEEKVPTLEELPAGVPVTDNVMNSSNWNKQRPEDIASIFENVLEGKVKYGPFEFHDVLVYQNGLRFLGEKKLSKALKGELASIARKEKFTIKYIDIKDGTEVHVFLGETMKLPDDVMSRLNKKETAIQRVYDTLLDYWGDVLWWYWFETEESLYE